MSNIMLTAGYDRAWHSILIAERLRQADYAPGLILLAYPFSISRTRTIMRSRGKVAILNYLLRRKNSNCKSLVEKECNAYGIYSPSLSRWAKKNGVKVVKVSSFGSACSMREVKKFKPALTVYSGGGILQKEFLDSLPGLVLNAHSGPLPCVRGMNALEWSLLLNKSIGTTIHCIDEGIDTGDVVSWIALPLDVGDDLDLLRQRLILAGAKAITAFAQEAAEGRLSTTPIAGARLYRQCFVAAPALYELAELRLKQRLAKHLGYMDE